MQARDTPGIAGLPFVAGAVAHALEQFVSAARRRCFHLQPWGGVVLVLLPWPAAVSAPASAQDLLAEGQAFLQRGQYRLALESLAAARDLASQADLKAQADGALGLTYFRMQQTEAAEQHLSRALQGPGTDPHSRARWSATLANLYAEQRRFDAARHWYGEAERSVAGDAVLAAGIALGKAGLLLPEERFSAFAKLLAQFTTLPVSDPRNGYLLHLAMQAKSLGKSALRLRYEALHQAASSAPGSRLHVEAMNELAQLYEEEGKPGDALRLTTAAMAEAQRANAPDILLLLQWRQGRLLQAQDSRAAIAAYQRAVEQIEALRHDIPIAYHDGRSSFRETLEPLYLQLADLLLRQAQAQPVTARKPLLAHAREVVELLKKAELEDYLGGRCALASARQTGIDAISPGTAVVYPVLLPDRLELLVSVGDELRQFTQAVPRARLETLARDFALALRTRQAGIAELAQVLYQWLLAPLESWLQQQSVHILVVVPDGVLRLVPYAALHDGKRFVAERYATGVSPGLSLLAPQAGARPAGAILLAGLSAPGPVLTRLPNNFLTTLGVERGATRDRPLPGQQPGHDEAGPAAAERAAQSGLFELLQLPGVETELRSLQQQGTATLLLNDRFTKTGFTGELLNGRYSVVHIATHWVLGNNAADSFVMAYDDVISMNQIESLLKTDKFARAPVELLTLSACQTAAGDDRLPLGLSGVAIKTRVRSALGTLWPVSDRASASLLPRFYQALRLPENSKVEALRAAQTQLLQQKDYAHPFYWAPYVLVGNWL